MLNEVVQSQGILREWDELAYEDEILARPIQRLQRTSRRMSGDEALDHAYKGESHPQMSCI